MGECESECVWEWEGGGVRLRDSERMRKERGGKREQEGEERERGIERYCA